MSDSSEDEDLSCFREAVDPTFVKLIDAQKDKSFQCVTTGHSRSERYLEVSSHYNDIKVPKEMQKCIGDKVSALINNLVEYVDVEQQNVKQIKTKSRIKLFNDSEGFLSYKEVEDTYTECHNKMSKKNKRNQKRRLIEHDVAEFMEFDRIKAAVVTGEYVQSKKDTQHWVSRRKEKLYTYKPCGKTKNILIKL